MGGECRTTDRDHQLISQIWLHLFKPRPAHTPATRVQVARSIDLYQYVLDLTSGAAVILELGLVYFPSPMCTAAPCRSPGVIHIFVDMFIYLFIGCRFQIQTPPIRPLYGTTLPGRPSPCPRRSPASPVHPPRTHGAGKNTHTVNPCKMQSPARPLTHPAPPEPGRCPPNRQVDSKLPLCFAASF